MRTPTIETTRLLLRPFALDDLDDLHHLWTEPGMRKYLWDDEVISRERVESIIETSCASFSDHGFGLWAVLGESHKALVGFCGFWFFHDPPKLELVYGIASAYWGQGLVTEVASAMLTYGFEELSLERIEASTDKPNVASSKVMEKIGMSFWKRETTNDLDTIYYSISRDAFDQTKPM